MIVLRWLKNPFLQIKPQRLAAALGVDVHNIYNANRRLKNRLQKVVM